MNQNKTKTVAEYDEHLDNILTCQTSLLKYKTLFWPEKS